MPLKFKYATKQEIPAEHQAFYVERDGAWLLDADGVVSQTKLDEFRQNNITLTNQLKKFEGIDPDAVRQLADDKRKLEEAQQLKAGEVDKVIEARLKTARAEWDKQHGVVVAERDALNGRLTAIQIDQAVVTEATKRGLRPTALTDITARARMTFKLVNGVPQAFEADGQTARMGKDGVSPMTLAEWVDALVSDAPHLFEANAGSGAAGSGGGAAGNRSVKNPFRKESFNLTEQMKIEKSDPQLAARLKAAGVTGSQTQRLSLWQRHNWQTSSCQRSSLVTFFSARRRNPTCSNPALSSARRTMTRAPRSAARKSTCRTGMI